MLKIGQFESKNIEVWLKPLVSTLVKPSSYIGSKKNIIEESRDKGDP